MIRFLLLSDMYTLVYMDTLFIEVSRALLAYSPYLYTDKRTWDYNARSSSSIKFLITCLYNNIVLTFTQYNFSIIRSTSILYKSFYSFHRANYYYFLRSNSHVFYWVIFFSLYLAYFFTICWVYFCSLYWVHFNYFLLGLILIFLLGFLFW